MIASNPLPVAPIQLQIDRHAPALTAATVHHGVDQAAVQSALQRWKQAWESKDLDGYFAAYSDAFQPVAPARYGHRRWSRATWQTYKRRVIGRKRYIHIHLRHVSVLPTDNPQRVRVRFVQDFRSNNYVSHDHKELLMQREGGQWKIIQERVR